MLTITSQAFGHNGDVPVKYTCQGEDVNPPLNIDGIPEKTKSLALIVYDPDAPGGNWDHWIVWNILPGNIGENSVPGIQGINDFGREEYGGPCPPSGKHRYFFRVFALDIMLDLKESARRKDLEKAMEGHIIEKAELVGLYEKK